MDLVSGVEAGICQPGIVSDQACEEPVRDVATVDFELLDHLHAPLLGAQNVDPADPGVNEIFVIFCIYFNAL